MNAVVSTEKIEFQTATGSKLPTLDEVQDAYIKFVIEQSKGKKSTAARVLGINRRTLYRRNRVAAGAEEPPVAPAPQDDDTDEGYF